jgi:O-antigen ligase
LEIFLYPHNILLNFWSEIGLAGVLLFIWIILKYFGLGISTLVIAAPEPQSRNMNETKIWIPGQARNDRKEWKFFNIGLICAMVVILVHGLVDVPYFKNDLAVMFWLYVAMMSLVNLETKYGIANRRKNIV